MLQRPLAEIHDIGRLVYPYHPIGRACSQLKALCFWPKFNVSDRSARIYQICSTHPVPRATFPRNGNFTNYKKILCKILFHYHQLCSCGKLRVLIYSRFWYLFTWTLWDIIFCNQISDIIHFYYSAQPPPPPSQATRLIMNNKCPKKLLLWTNFQ